MHNYIFHYNYHSSYIDVYISARKAIHQEAFNKEKQPGKTTDN